MKQAVRSSMRSRAGRSLPGRVHADPERKTNGGRSLPGPFARRTASPRSSARFGPRAEFLKNCINSDKFTTFSDKFLKIHLIES